MALPRRGDCAAGDPWPAAPAGMDVAGPAGASSAGPPCTKSCRHG